jgi:nitrite reductase (NO-forming)
MQRILLVFITMLITGCTAIHTKQALPMDRFGSVAPELASIPFLPVHKQVDTGTRKSIEVWLNRDQEIQVSGNVTIQVTTLQGSVPGSIVIVQQDDKAELVLVSTEISKFKNKEISIN